jgi:hypothetical protein
MLAQIHTEEMADIHTASNAVLRLVTVKMLLRIA